MFSLLKFLIVVSISLYAGFSFSKWWTKFTGSNTTTSSSHLKKYLTDFPVNDCKLQQRLKNKKFDTTELEKGAVLRIISFDAKSQKFSVTIIDRKHQPFSDSWTSKDCE